MKGRGFESQQILDGYGVKAMLERYLHPILVHLIVENKENIGSQKGHTISEKNWAKILAVLKVEY